MKYIVTVQEIVSKDIVIEDAENEYDALEKVVDKYESGELELDVDYDIGVSEETVFTCGKKEIRKF